MLWSEYVPPFVRRHAPTLLTYGLAVVMGVALGVVVPKLGGESLYRLIMAVVGILIALGMMISGQVERMLVFFTVLTLSITLSFSPFGDVDLHAGGASVGVLIYLYDLPLVGMILVYAGSVLLGRILLRLTAVDGVALLWIMWSFLSLANSSDLALSMAEIIRMIKLYLLGHIIASVVDDEQGVHDVVNALLLSLLLQSAFGLGQYLFDLNLASFGFVVGDFRRISGLIGWPNTFGAYMAAVLCFPIAAWLWRGAGRLRVFAPGLALIGFFPLIFSFSRGSWLGLIAGVAVIIVLGRLAMPLRQDTIIRLALIGVLALGAVLLFYNEISVRLAQDSLTVREQLNEVAFNMIEANLLLGVGLNTFEPVMVSYDTVGVTEYFREPVHNVFLLIGAETGLVGLGLFLLLVGLVCWQGLQVLRRGSPYLIVMQLAVLGALIVLMVTNLFDVHLRTDTNYGLFWLLLGLTLAMRRMASRSARVRTPPAECGPDLAAA